MKQLIEILTNNYRFNPRKFVYEKRFPSYLILGPAFIIVFILWIIYFSGYHNQKKDLERARIKIKHLEMLDEKQALSKYDYYIDGDEAWKDSVFKDYAKRAQLYLDRPDNKGTPLTGEMMALAARNAYDSTGVLLPVELALSQAVWESSLGRRGRSPVNNPWNIGEYDSGTVMWFSSTFEGTQSYYYWMTRTYLKCKTVEQLMINFVNCNGSRYAKPGYEMKIHPTYINIKNWINRNLNE